MASTIEPFTVTSGSASLITYLPPGPSSIYLSAGPGTVGMYLGLSTTLTVSNGIYVPSGGLPFHTDRYPGLGGRALYGIAVSGTINSAVLIIYP